MKIITFMLLLLASTSFAKADDPSKVATDQKIGESLNAHRYANIYFAGQPSDQDLKKLKEQGFSAVINMRVPSEHDEAQEKKLVESNNMSYYNFPYPPSMKLSDDYINQITAAIQKHRPSGKVLLHCGSGSRVGIWIGGHFFKDHKFSKKESLEIAKKLGLASSGAQTKLNEYLQSK